MATRGWESVKAIVSPAKPAQKRATMPQAARSKYRAIRTEVDGITFDSKREAARYGELLVLGRVGEIRNLELQPRFQIMLNGRAIATYVADFRYEWRVHFYDPPAEDRWDDTIEDVKGMKTPVYRLKKKLVEAQYGIVIREIR